jgi:ketosteroid isomerase-like protein
MTVTSEYVREIFKGLEQGDGAAFFEHVADDVDWIVMGSHPLAGHYRSKSDFIAGTFAKLSQVLPRGAQLHVEHLIVEGDQAAVELRGGENRSRSRLSRLGHGRPIVHLIHMALADGKSGLGLSGWSNPPRWLRSSSWLAPAAARRASAHPARHG